jgi:hypothetical protein
MNFLDIRAFVPSGKDYERSKQLFLELGFELVFEGGCMAGFEKDGCKFFLQNYDSGECPQQGLYHPGLYYPPTPLDGKATLSLPPGRLASAHFPAHTPARHY